MESINYKYGESDHRYEELMLNHLEKVVKQNYDDTNQILLLENYIINGIKINAIVVTSETLLLFIFKNYSGEIVPSMKGEWITVEGKTVEGGCGATTPYAQARIYKRAMEKWLGQILHKRLSVKVCLVFQEGTTIQQIDWNGAKKWFDVITIADIETYLINSAKVNSSETEVLGQVLKVINNNESFRFQEALTPTDAVLDFFVEMENIPKDLPIKEKYAVLKDIFYKAVEQKIKGVDIVFTGIFSKIQYLIREYGIDKTLAFGIHDARVRLKNIESSNDNELSKSFYADLKSICVFISVINDGAFVPQSLSSHFPVNIEKDYKRRLKDSFGTNYDYIRCIVNEWDSSYLYVTIEKTGEDAKVDYVTAHEYNLKGDWSYISKLLEVGDVVNLIKPRVDKGVIYPELIICNPDYLVNVTSIAGCFEEYGSSYKKNFLNKISTMPCTQAVLLGNFAGQLLDESSYHKNISYSESVKHFFQKNALSFACCKEPLETFHIEAKSQKNIIDDVINNNKIHTKTGNPISSKELILEPSYFCEALGLQGRMDFIHYDLNTIIEQKSGKCAWTGKADTVCQLKKHYVQVLLYRAIFHYAYKKIDYDHLASWLFYSKFKKGLLELGSMPVLLFEAIKIRNLIVWSERLYTKQGMYMLEDMTADTIFPNVTNESFLKWGKDRINSLLSPIHKASNLEKAYYYRFMRFIAKEHMLSKVGSKTKEDSGVATMWNSSLKERKEAGNIFDKLSLEIINDVTEVETVRFIFKEKVDQDISNFRVGDIVVFYPYNKTNGEPVVTNSIVFRGTITDIEIEYVDVKLRNAQNKNVFDYITNEYVINLEWAVEHDFMESSYSSLYRGMHAFLSANQDRKDLILGQRMPRVDASKQLVGDYESPEFNDLVLRAKQAQDIYLIVGPPGTGKTSFGMLNVLLEHLTEPNASVLLMAYTNRAVDEICSKLVGKDLDFIRLGSDSGCSPKYRKYLLDSKIASISNIKIEVVKDVVTNCRIFCGTTTAFNSKTEIFNLKQFDLAIIDEASQILEPFVLGLLSATHMENGKAVNAISKFVLIGDEKQLPAVVQQEKDESIVNDPILNKIGLTDCRLSLFERFEKLLNKKDERYCHVLTHQGRMHPEIAKFPNYTFYQNTLTPVPIPHQLEDTPLKGNGRNGIEDLLLTRRVSFLSCTPINVFKESDKVNCSEAQIIAATVVQAYLMMKEHFDVNNSIGIIVPYRNQISTIRNMIDKMGKEKGITCLHNITIDTVERYQGSQRDLIIYGFTAKKNYQLNFLTSNEYYDENDGAIIDRKLNVAMTRAKKNLVLVGNDQMLAQDITFYKLIEYCKSIQSYFQIDTNKYVKGEFSIPELKTIENSDFVNSVFEVDYNFQKAFDKLVIKPIKEASNTEWPNIILGNKMDVNMNIIGYGRIEFSNQLSLYSEFSCEDVSISPQQQVLLYSYYIMRQHYCSLKAILASYKTFIQSKLDACNGRLYYVDIGCGPATCGSSFFNAFSDIKHAEYIGVDISYAMKELAERFIIEQNFNNVTPNFISSFNELTDDYWKAKSEVPSFFIFNISYFFSNVKADFTVKLAMRLMDVIRRYPLNQYLFIIQQSETDCKNFRSYRIFKKLILEESSSIKVLKSGEDYFNYQLASTNKSLKFCYDIWGN